MATRIRGARTAMRKTPRQERSRATVEAILEAAARILGRRGWEGFKTNEVASTAGVSIGSLYQYFPHKAALADALKQRHFAELLAALGSANEAPPASMEQRVARLVSGLIAAHAVDPGLHAVLLEEVPHNPTARKDAFKAEYLRRYKALIVPDGDAGDPGATDLAVHVLSSAVEGVVHDAAHRGVLGSPALVREITTLVQAYLERRLQGPAHVERRRPS